MPIGVPGSAQKIREPSRFMGESYARLRESSGFLLFFVDEKGELHCRYGRPGDEFKGQKVQTELDVLFENAHAVIPFVNGNSSSHYIIGRTNWWKKKDQGVIKNGEIRGAEPVVRQISSKSGLVRALENEEKVNAKKALELKRRAALAIGERFTEVVPEVVKKPKLKEISGSFVRAKETTKSNRGRPKQVFDAANTTKMFSF
jgi:hypothetical protein